MPYSIAGPGIRSGKPAILDAMEMFKVLVTGAREQHASDALYVQLEARVHLLVQPRKPDRVMVIEGGATGVDRASKIFATKFGIHVAQVDALWPFYHNAAGPKRNTVMLALAPDLVLAFHPDLSKSRGTKNMVEQA